MPKQCAEVPCPLRAWFKIVAFSMVKITLPLILWYLDSDKVPELLGIGVYCGAFDVDVDVVLIVRN